MIVKRIMAPFVEEEKQDSPMLGAAFIFLGIAGISDFGTLSESLREKRKTK